MPRQRDRACHMLTYSRFSLQEQIFIKFWKILYGLQFPKSFHDHFRFAIFLNIRVNQNENIRLNPLVTIRCLNTITHKVLDYIVFNTLGDFDNSSVFFYMLSIIWITIIFISEYVATCSPNRISLTLSARGGGIV